MAITIGICTWSLDQHGRLPTATVLPLLRTLGLTHIHLNLNPLLDAPVAERSHMVEEWRESGMIIPAAMVGFAGEDYTSHASIQRTGGFVPEELFAERLARTSAAADLCGALGIGLLTTHAGFLPERGEAGFGTMVERLRAVADACAARGILLGLETGQERADTLLGFLEALERPIVGINFDPANMLLYGKGDPIAAAGLLFERILHVHAKDAKLHPPTATGWAGDEVPLGEGDARLGELVALLQRRGYGGTIAIEREAGEERLADARAGIGFLRQAIESGIGSY